MNDQEPELLPSGQQLETCLVMLLGREVNVEALPLAEIPELYEIRARYGGDAGELGGIITMELGLAAGLAAALTLTPIRVVEEAIELGALSELLLENLHETFNVFSVLFNGEGLPHLRLAAVTGPELPDPELEVIADRPPLFREYDLDLDEYGKGAVVFYRPWTSLP